MCVYLDIYIYKYVYIYVSIYIYIYTYHIYIHNYTRYTIFHIENGRLYGTYQDMCSCWNSASMTLRQELTH